MSAADRHILSRKPSSNGLHIERFWEARCNRLGGDLQPGTGSKPWRNRERARLTEKNHEAPNGVASNFGEKSLRLCAYPEDRRYVHRTIRAVRRCAVCGGHAGVQEFLNVLGGRRTEFHLFTFVRNPWDRLVSAFEYMSKGGANPRDQAVEERYLRKFNGDFGTFVEALAEDEGSNRSAAFSTPDNLRREWPR